MRLVPRVMPASSNAFFSTNTRGPSRKPLEPPGSSSKTAAYLELAFAEAEFVADLYVELFEQDAGDDGPVVLQELVVGTARRVDRLKLPTRGNAGPMPFSSTNSTVWFAGSDGRAMSAAEMRLVAGLDYR